MKKNPEFRIEGFSADDNIRKKQIGILIEKRDKIFKELQEKKNRKSDEGR